MEILQSIKAWLMGYPGLAGILVDKTPGAPGSCGLFPLGGTKKSHREDITGCVKETWRQSFALRRNDLHNLEAAAWLLDFQDWVRRQSHAGLAPQLGANSRVRAEKGALIQSGGAGTATYQVQLIFEYEKE